MRNISLLNFKYFELYLHIYREMYLITSGLPQIKTGYINNGILKMAYIISGRYHPTQAITNQWYIHEIDLY